MTEAVAERMAELNAQETRFVFESFDHAAAWQLGTQMVERARSESLPVIIDIRRPGLVLFRSALAGTTAENEAWLDRK
ncbi:MAG TPA: heme-binding protein, partial [Propionibacteriaceae bacterium]|nr:heme-binding protein [Propionibacteriaceae bacterium]